MGNEDEQGAMSGSIIASSLWSEGTGLSACGGGWPGPHRHCCRVPAPALAFRHSRCGLTKPHARRYGCSARALVPERSQQRTGLCHHHGLAGWTSSLSKTATIDARVRGLPVPPRYGGTWHIHGCLHADPRGVRQTTTHYAGVVGNAATSSFKAVVDYLASDAKPEGPPPLPRQPKPLPTDPDALRKLLSSPQVLLLPADGEVFLRARWDDQWNVDEGVFGVPSAIARPTTEGDVVQLVKYCSLHHSKGLRLAVTCGRHSHYCMPDDALIIDMSAFNSVEVESAQMIVKVGGGARLGALDAACKPFGLAVTAGHDSTTGVGGLTLNGGHGYLERVYGLTVDNLLGARVVLASGMTVNASEKDYPDLFWALRGGGGNFGIVMSFTLRLHRLPHDGMLLCGHRVHMPFWPLPDRKALLDHYDATTRDAPDQYVANLVLTKLPVVEVCAWLGDRAEGITYMEKHIWSVGWPVQDTCKSTALVGQSYHSVLQQEARQPGVPDRAYYYLKSIITNGLSADFKAAVLASQAEIAGEGAILLQLVGGKAARIAPDATAVPFREAKYFVLIIGSWGKKTTHSAELRQQVVQWVKSTYDRLAPLAGSVGNYGNVPSLDDHDDPLAAKLAGGAEPLTMYGDNLPKLRATKKKYDPKNLFTHNANIPPK